jgi:chemotaxis signal transduction protein
VSDFEEKLVTFEVNGAAYALPIRDVLEVAEVGRVALVPTLPREVGGVVNHHGDALPVLARGALFEAGDAAAARPQHLLVLAGRPGDAAGKLGLPVDRILGIVPGRGGAAREPSGVVERRPMDGRVVSILDTKRLLERAATSIARRGERGAQTGGES